MHLKLLSVKYRPFGFSLNELQTLRYVFCVLLCQGYSFSVPHSQFLSSEVFSCLAVTWDDTRSWPFLMKSADGTRDYESDTEDYQTTNYNLEQRWPGLLTFINISLSIDEFTLSKSMQIKENKVDSSFLHTILSKNMIIWENIDEKQTCKKLLKTIAWIRNFWWKVSIPIFHQDKMPLTEIPKGSWAHAGFLTHWGRDKMAAVSQSTLSNAFSGMKMLEFRLRFHWSLFLRVKLTIVQHWFR